MDHTVTNSKGKTDNWEYRDWERHSRVIACLHDKRLTIQEMSEAIGEPIYSVSKCIWGVPGRQITRIEDKIATFLGVARNELFGNGVA